MLRTVDKVFQNIVLDALTIPIYLHLQSFLYFFFTSFSPSSSLILRFTFFSLSLGALHVAYILHTHSTTMNHKDDWLFLNTELVVDELALIYVCISTFRCIVLWRHIVSSTCPVAVAVAAASVVFDECFIIWSKI